MNVDGSISKGDLQRGVRILAKASAESNESIIRQGVCIFLKGISCIDKDADIRRVKFTPYEKVELMEVINKLRTITDTEKQFLASLIKMNAKEAVYILARMFDGRTDDRYPLAEKFLLMLMDTVSNGESHESCDCCVKKLINEVMCYNKRCESNGGTEITDDELMEVVKVIVE